MSFNKTSFITHQKNFWSENSYLWFILPFIALPLATKGVSLLASISFIIAIVILLKNSSFIIQSLIKNRYLYIFLAMFIPVGISLIDSLSPKLTSQTLWRMIRFSSYAILALFIFRSSSVRNKFSTALFWLLILFCIDAICQWLFDFNIYGYNPTSNAWLNRVRGVFGERYDLSYFLATFSPLIFFYLLEKIQQKKTFYIYLTPILIFILVFTIFIGGARTGMFSIGVSLFFFMSYMLYQRKIPLTKTFWCLLILFVIATIVILSQVDVISSRISDSLNTNSLSQLTSNRTNLWSVAWSEFPNYWINGVGVRGFDALYQTYPASYNIYPYANHPHLQGLEVLIETGLIGFIPYIAVCLYLLVSFFRSKQNNPWLLIAFLTMMPINSYAGLYEGNWLPVVFISLALATSFSKEASFSPTPRNGKK